MAACLKISVEKKLKGPVWFLQTFLKQFYIFLENEVLSRGDIFLLLVYEKYKTINQNNFVIVNVWVTDDFFKLLQCF